MKLPELKKKLSNKYSVRIVAGVLTIALFGSSLGAYTVYADKSNGEEIVVAEKENTVDNNTDMKDASDKDTGSKGNDNGEKSEDKIDKDESVYFITDATGKVEKTIVSDHLFNREGASQIEDASILTDIRNVKGDETFSRNGEKLTWQADGKEIYYQGTTSREAPVTQKVTYYLDGKKVTPEELAGKSGKVTIRYDYTNNSSYTEKIGKKDVTVCVPFAAVTTLVLDDSFSNIEVQNGKLELSGNKSVAVGYALPGLKNSLGIKDGSLKDGKEIPEYFEINADVENFELSTAMTVVVNAGDFIASEDRKENPGESINELVDATDKLEDGSEELADGAEKLNSKMGTFKDGVSTLSSGLKDYLDGTRKLDDGIGDLKNGIDKLSEGADSLGKGVTKLENGASNAVSGAKQLVAGYEGNKESAGLVDGAKAVADGANQLNEAVSKLSGSISQTVKAQVQETLDSKINHTTAVALIGALGYDKVTISNVEEITGKVMANEASLEAALTAQGADDATAQETYNTLLAGLCQAQGALTVAGSMSSSGSGLEQLVSAAESLKSGAEAVSAGVQKEYEGTIQLEQGLETLEGGIETLDSSVPSLTDGISKLSSGVKQLKNGSGTLVSNNEKISSGMDGLSDGANKIVDGSSQLADGSRKLADGIIEFNKEGINKLVDSYDGDIAELANHLQAVLDAGSEYKTFTSISDGAKGKVKFIYKLGAIKASQRARE